LFVHKIKPAWEDEVNAQGGDFQINFKSENLDVVQTLWERLVFRVITGVFPHTHLLAGIRLLDKSKEGNEGVYRIEVWVKFGEANFQEAREIRSYLLDHFGLLIYNNGDSRMLKFSEEHHKEKWIEFKPHTTGSHSTHHSKPKGGLSQSAIYK
jgi:hypothetical protein